MPCNTEVTVQVVTPSQPIRLRTRLIGVDPHRSLIFALGSDNSWQEAKKFLKPGQPIIVRLVNSDEPDANILAFRSSIRKLLSSTEPWLIIDYPKALQKVALRQHSRIAVNLEASIQVMPVEGSDEVETTQLLSPGQLSNISINGGAFIGKILQEISVDTPCLLQVKVLQETETMSIPITIKNIQDIEYGRMRGQYGFELSGEKSETEAFVQKVILNHLLQQPK
ncbi:flagellar brake domain-containing protein [Shewanella atlantica]|uniref:Flagellar brake protein n=1 Tax=Shewanella atlantica TaxID=271099 RepID=A0A3S0IA91_9GAMM|nr:flagellar brake domain-containing protein [Shewanella atlantica]RTR28860.1 flagellar brake protein [Shewanella atlantica]